MKRLGYWRCALRFSQQYQYFKLHLTDSFFAAFIDYLYTGLFIYSVII